MIIFIIVLQLLTFTGLVFAFRMFLNKQLTNEVLRLKNLQKEYLSRDEELRKNLDAARSSKEKLLATAREDAESIVSNAKAEASSIVDNARFEAKNQVSLILQRAEDQSLKKHAQIDNEIREQAVLLLHEIINELFTDDEFYDFRQSLIHSAMTGIPKEILSAGGDVVNVLVSEKLSPTNHALIKDIVAKHWGKKVDVLINVNQHIGEGILIKAGGIEIDGTLRNRVNHIINRLDIDSGLV